MKQETNSIDIVIPYVNNNDEIWREQYNIYNSQVLNCTNKSISNERTREVFSLKYVFRSFEKHAKFVKNIYLVVQTESQVPSWVNRDTVTVVLHEQFIPKELLPTYNSHTIEMFIHKIPGLSNKFVYFNDDMVLLKDIYEEDLFDGDIPRDLFYEKNINDIAYYYSLDNLKYDEYPEIRIHPQINNTLFALKYNNLTFNKEIFYTPSHGPSVLNKEFMTEIFNNYNDEFINRCTRFREDINTYIYLYRLSSYLKYKRLSLITTNYITFKASPVALKNNILDSNFDCICINDDGYDDNKIESQKHIITSCLNKLFSAPCKYEKQNTIAICCVCKGRIKSIKNWIKHHINIGVNTFYIYDIGGLNYNDINTYKTNINIHYKVVKNITRAKQQYYKKLYKTNYLNFNWLIFIDPDEYISCDNCNIHSFLNENVFDNFDIIKLNRSNYFENLSGNMIGFDKKVKCILRGKNNKISFFGKPFNIYNSCTNVPNPSTVYNVCDCDGKLSCDPYFSTCSNKVYIKRLLGKNLQDLYEKTFNGGILTEPLYCQKNISILEDKLMLYRDFIKTPLKIKHTLFSDNYVIKKQYNKQTDIDYVFPYVDMNDPIWYMQYKQYMPPSEDNDLFGAPRYENYNLLKYKLRSIEQNMPWIRNIIMLVSSMSQVPDWLDTSKVKIVCHNEFIFNDFLPVFNSSAIEMFLWNIPDLSEKFIYSNDDVYIMNKVEPYMFFRGNMCASYLTEQSKIAKNSVNSNNIAFKLAGWSMVAENDELCKKDYVWKPLHCDHAFLKSTCKTVFNKYKEQILNSITKFREDNNFNQYIYIYYNILNKKTFIYKNNNAAFLLTGNRTITQKLINDIKNNISDLISIDFTDQTTNDVISIIELLLKNKFPNKSKYEK